ncbi:MAG: FmdB family zinc ribbon protein [Planctomycetota bacterium]|jgi:putative FmdB family regulatory protein
MPTYDYECASCGHAFEEFQMMSDKVLRKCPECKRMKLQRLLGAGSGIIFKGSGFYETDYKKKTGKPSGESSKDESKSESKKTEKKTAKKKDD